MQEIKLNRACNMFRPKFWILPGITIMVCILFFFLSSDPTEELIMSYLTFLAILITAEIFSYPKTVSIGKDTVCYNAMQTVHIRPGRGGSTSVKVQYTVTYLHSVSFRQNYFEKLFNTGTLTFGGCTNMEAERHEDKIEFPKIHTISGIKKFSETKSIIEGILQG